MSIPLILPRSGEAATDVVDMISRRERGGNADIDWMRGVVFKALTEHVDGMTAHELGALVSEYGGLLRLVLADAVVEGELIRVAVSGITGHAHHYRLSPQKWIEMEAACDRSRSKG